MAGKSKKTNVNDLLSKFEEQENAFLTQEFLAPSLQGGSVAVRLAGATCQLTVTPKDFRGWGIFQPLSHSTANLVREASLSERREYLKLFPRIQLIACRRIGRIWFASAASFGDARVKLEGVTPISLASEVQLFDCINTRYDGSRFWFEEIDSRSDPTAATFLRKAIADRTAPEKIEKSGLTAEQRAAYELNFWELTGRETEETDEASIPSASPLSPDPDHLRLRLRQSLSHAGANLIDYLEREDSCRVTFSVGGVSYTSSVRTSDLSVEVAGICLSGEDHKFDLSSLVGVLREGEGSGEIYRDY